MKKRFTRILAALALLVGLTIPMGMWGQAPVNTVLWTEDFSGYAANAVPSGSITNSHTGTTIYGDATLTYACTESGTKVYTSGGPNGNNNLLIAKNNGTFTVSNIPTGGATELTVTYAKSGSGTIAISTTTAGVQISDSNSGATITTNGASTIDLTFTNTKTNDNLRFDDGSVTVKTAGGGQQLTSTTTIITAPQGFNNDLYVGTSAGTLTASVTETNGGAAVSGAAVVWASTDTNVATVDQTGAVTLLAVGTTNITATYEGNTTYAPSTGTYQLNVVDNTPFDGVIFYATVDKDENNTSQGAGSITKDNVTYSCTSGILGNGTEYRMYKSSTTTIATTDGSTITKIEFIGVSGNPASGFGSQDGWTTSGNNGVWQGEATSVQFVASGAQVRATEIRVSVVANTNPVVPAITIDPSTVNATAAETDGTLFVTYIDINSEAGVEIHWFDAAGQRIQNGYDWMDADLDDNWNIYYTIGANDGEARTAYLKIYGVDEDVNDVYSNLVTITQEAFVPLFIGADPSTIEVGCQGTDNGNFEVLFDERLQSPYGSSVVLCFYDENDNQINDDPEWFQYQYIQDYHSFEYTISENTSTEPRTARMKIKYTDPYTTATIFSDYILINQDAYEAPSLTGTITFGSAQGSTSINSTSVTGKDSMGNTWTITTTFDGEESFTPQPGYAQVGSAKKPASSITFTTTLPEVKTITSFEAKFGGFSGTAGAINLFVDESTVGTGVLNEAEDVVVNSTAAEGTVLTVTVTNIAKGVKCYYISYTLEEATPAGPSITVNGYGDTDGGYVLLAWPENISPTAINGMISDNLSTVTPQTATYDLYFYDGSEEKEWRNYRTNSFNLVPGKGYLYASKEGVTLTYEGEANPDFEEVDNLPYTENDLVKSIYLAGNSKTNEQTFYVYNSELAKQTFNYLTMNEDGDGFISGQGAEYTVPAMTGFFVQAPGAGMTLSTTDVNAKANASLLNINVLRSRGSVIDNAIVSFSNGSMMEKFYLMNNTTRVYIPQGNRELAIANSAAEAEMPVSFRASENGTYTLTVEAENVEMNYLHLIDNMTGMDIDLLQTPSYTFEANTNDYANRFKLVFAANSTDEADESSFAFFSNGNLIVNNEGNATLQVIDINGRILSSETISGSCSKAINATTGVYMLRLINGENVKVQKVVVR